MRSIAPRRRSANDLEGVNLLEVAPVRLADWKEVGERVVIERRRPDRRGPTALRQWLSFVLSVKRVRLDEVGTFVWLRLDGRQTVGELAGELRERFGEAVEPAEERLGLLVRALRDQGFVAYPGWDDPAVGPTT